jgi:hypothetical protein
MGLSLEGREVEAAEVSPRFSRWYTNICVGIIIEHEGTRFLEFDTTNPTSVKLFIVSKGTFSIHLGVTSEFIVDPDCCSGEWSAIHKTRWEMLARKAEPSFVLVNGFHLQ